MVPPPMTRTAGVPRAPRCHGGGLQIWCARARRRPHRLPVHATAASLAARADGPGRARRSALARGLLTGGVIGAAAAASVAAAVPHDHVRGGLAVQGSGSRDRVTLSVDARPGRRADRPGRRLRRPSGADAGRPRCARRGFVRRSIGTAATPTGTWSPTAPIGSGPRPPPARTSITVSDWVTKAPHVPYARRPGAIVVAINPGHGGSDPGAVVGGTREKDMNLAISLRLRRMLEGAGIGWS